MSLSAEDEAAFSSMKTSLMRPSIKVAPTGTYDLDHNTTPEVVIISKASNMARCG